MSAATTLYTRDVLALAASLAQWPLDPNLELHGEARSATCGSTIEVQLACDAAGAIERLGLRTRACAIGQAAAAIFAAAAPGNTRIAIANALAEVDAWLAGGPLPQWPGFAAIAAARDYPARHGAIRLPWRAALVALDGRG